MTWAQDQRIAFIKERIEAGEKINRSDLRGKFFISVQTATSTFHEFERRYPGVMRYCPTTKAMVPAAWVADSAIDWKARAEKAEASLVELAEVTKPFAGVVINSAWTDETPAYGSLTVGHFRRASDVHSRLLEEQFAENAKCSGLSQSQPGVSAVQLPASPSAQHSDGGRG